MHKIMTVVIDKQQSRHEVVAMLDGFEPMKIFDAAKFAGKIQWHEDPLACQKRQRNEWQQKHCLLKVVL
jgi:hypothetical protein